MRSMIISIALNWVITLRWPVNDLAHCSTATNTTGDMITESIMAILQPHTSSLSLHIIASTITSWLQETSIIITSGRS